VNAPISRFSATVRRGKIFRPSGDWTRPSATISCGGSPPMSRPPNRIVPVRARTQPEMVMSVVVLPAPLAPMSVTISPPSTDRLMPCSASMLP